jgi:polar amino acid transport system substrate-binding protein
MLVILLLFSHYGVGREFILASDDGPPHMIEQENAGIDIDIARAVLKMMGYEVTVEFASLERGKKKVLNKKVNGVTPTYLGDDTPGFYVSDATVNYLPTVFTLSKNSLIVESITDLKNLSVVSFQGASGYFGPTYNHAVKSSKHYLELADMSKFPNLLLKQRFDAVVLDLYIFYYFYRFDDLRRDLSVFTAHNVIKPVKAGVGFNDKRLRNAFNRYLAEFKQSIEYAEIEHKYIGNILPIDH